VSFTMKRTILIIGILILTTNIVIADNVPSKTHIIGVNPILLYYKIFTGHYGVITKNGAREIYVPVTMIISKNGTLFYPTLSYRFFKGNQGKGNFNSLFLGFPSMYSKRLNTYVIGIEPGLETGYRWTFKSGITIAPTIGAGFVFVKGDSFKGNITLYDKSLTIKLRLGLGYSF